MRVQFRYSSKFTQKHRKPDNTNKHNVPFTEQVKKLITNSDILLEVVDSRFIEKTRNKDLEKEAERQNKRIIFVLNKSDLVDINKVKMEYDLNSVKPYVFFSSKNKVGRSRLRELIKIEAKKSKFEKARVGIIGYPNTGKSTLINVLIGGRRVGTSPKTGFTRNVQKVRFTDDIVILDSPGVISPGQENSINERVVTTQTEIGVKDYDKVKYPDLVINEIMKDNPELFDNFYKVESKNDPEILLEKLGKKWNFLKKGGEVDTQRAARRVLKDWQDGKIAKKKE